MFYRLAVIKMAVYAIISGKDNQTSLAYFKSKKISQNNRVPVARLKQLVQVLSAGDVQMHCAQYIRLHPQEVLNKTAYNSPFSFHSNTKIVRFCEHV